MIQTKTIAMILLIAITTVGAIGIGIGTGTQSVQGQKPSCFQQSGHDLDDSGKGLSFHDCNGDQNSQGHAFPHP